jgi:hypothetical protein
MKIDLKSPSRELQVILPDELKEFSYEQLQAKKDIELILRDSGLVIYGVIGLENPKI